MTGGDIIKRFFLGKMRLCIASGQVSGRSRSIVEDRKCPKCSLCFARGECSGPRLKAKSKEAKPRAKSKTEDLRPEAREPLLMDFKLVSNYKPQGDQAAAI